MNFNKNCRLASGLPVYQITSVFLQPRATKSEGITKKRKPWDYLDHGHPRSKGTFFAAFRRGNASDPTCFRAQNAIDLTHGW